MTDAWDDAPPDGVAIPVQIRRRTPEEVAHYARERIATLTKVAEGLEASAASIRRQIDTLASLLPTGERG